MSDSGTFGIGRSGGAALSGTYPSVQRNARTELSDRVVRPAQSGSAPAGDGSQEHREAAPARADAHPNARLDDASRAQLAADQTQAWLMAKRSTLRTAGRVDRATARNAAQAYGKQEAFFAGIKASFEPVPDNPLAALIEVSFAPPSPND